MRSFPLLQALLAGSKKATLARLVRQPRELGRRRSCRCCPRRRVSSSKCGPCKLLLPTLQAYAEKYPDVSFARFYFDADDSLRELVKQWSVQGVPSYRLYDEQGEMTKQFATGTPTKLGNTLYLFLS